MKQDLFCDKLCLKMFYYEFLKDSWLIFISKFFLTLANELLIIVYAL